MKIFCRFEFGLMFRLRVLRCYLLRLKSDLFQMNAVITAKTSCFRVPCTPSVVQRPKCAIAQFLLCFDISIQTPMNAHIHTDTLAPLKCQTIKTHICFNSSYIYARSLYFKSSVTIWLCENLKTFHFVCEQINRNNTSTERESVGKPIGQSYGVFTVQIIWKDAILCGCQWSKCWCIQHLVNGIVFGRFYDKII